MQPRLQKGAWSGCSGLPHNGQFFAWLGGFGISADMANAPVRPQLDRAADLRARAGRSSPAVLSITAMTAGWPTSRLRSGGSNAARRKQRPRLERRAILCQLDQRCVAARAHDLDEAEAVDRGALERLGQAFVDRRIGRLPRRLALDGRQIDADRPADVEAPDRLGRGVGAG